MHIPFRSKVLFTGGGSFGHDALTIFDGSKKEAIQRPSSTIENFRLRIQASNNGGSIIAPLPFFKISFKKRSEFLSRLITREHFF